MASTLKSTKPGQTKSGGLNGVTLEEVKSQWARPIGLDGMLEQLDTLAHPDDYDDDFQAPTPSAVVRTRAFLEEAGGSLEAAFPSGTICADGVGGLRIEWIRPDRELRLVVSRSQEGRSYLYHEQGADYAADYSPDFAKLGEWLQGKGFLEGCPQKGFPETDRHSRW